MMNWSVMLWAIFAVWCIKTPLSILVGMGCAGENKKYGAGDVLDGILTFILILWVALS